MTEHAENMIDANEPVEVQRLHDEFPGFTHQEIINAIQAYGPLRADVLHHLLERQKDKDPDA